MDKRYLQHEETPNEGAAESAKAPEIHDNAAVSSLRNRFSVLTMLALLGIIAGCGDKKNSSDIFSDTSSSSDAPFTTSVSTSIIGEAPDSEAEPFLCDPKSFDIHQILEQRDLKNRFGSCDDADTFRHLTQFAELVKGFYDPAHPESVFEKLKLAFDERTISDHIAVSEFLKNQIEEAAKKADLNKFERLLYHIIAFENSGGLYKGSSAGCVGPAQIKYDWLNNPICAGVENFKLFKDKTGRVIFDGRYDPIANVEAGARIFKYYINLAGDKHLDFAMLSYNQGEGSAMSFVEWWARNNMHQNKKVSKAYRDWCGKEPLPLDKPFVIKRKNRTVIRATWCPDGSGKNRKFPSPARFKLLLDKLDTPLAKMLEDERVFDGLMDGNNGGRGYLPKILAIWEALIHRQELQSIASEEIWRQAGGARGKNRKIAQVIDTDIEGGTIVFDGKTGEVKYTWDDLYMPMTLPRGISLKQFAAIHHLPFDMLVDVNRQIRDANAVFPEDVRIWTLTNKGAQAYNNHLIRFTEPRETAITRIAQKSKNLREQQPSKIPSMKKSPQRIPPKKLEPAKKFVPRSGKPIRHIRH